MQEKIYYYSKRKATVRIVIALAILILCSKLVFTAISTGELTRIGLLLFVGLIGLGAALYVIVSIPVLIFKPRKEIELSEKGIFSSDSNNSAIGLIPWDNISHVSLNKIENKSYICIHVHDSSGFSNKVKTKERRVLLESRLIALLIDNSDVNEELYTIFCEVDQYLKKFANNSLDEKNTSNSVSSKPSFNDIKIPVLESEVFMHYDSGIKQKKDFQNSNWMHQHVFFWSSKEKFEAKLLPPEFKEYQTKYFVIKKIPNLLKLSKMKMEPGNDDKYFFSRNSNFFPFEELFKARYLRYVKLIDKKHHIFYNLDNIYAVIDNTNESLFAGKEIVLGEALADDSVRLFQIEL